MTNVQTALLTVRPTPVAALFDDIQLRNNCITRCKTLKMLPDLLIRQLYERDQTLSYSKDLSINHRNSCHQSFIFADLFFAADY
jgi:hypothetical protein